jgi:competence protein ComGC
MDGVFGGFTRWAVVFLIIFVLFILIIPTAGGAGY